MTYKMPQFYCFYFLLSLVLASHAYGYIDMGTGSYVVQLAVAGVLGAIFTLKGYIKVIKSKFSNFFNALNNKRPK